MELCACMCARVYVKSCTYNCVRMCYCCKFSLMNVRVCVYALVFLRLCLCVCTYVNVYVRKIIIDNKDKIYTNKENNK